MLSYDTSDLPIAICKSGEIVHYHPKKVKFVEKLDYKSYDLTDDEADEVYNAIRGTKDASYPAKALEYYEKAKADIAEKTGKAISSSSKFMVVPMDIPKQRQYIVLTGMAGSGKSCWTADYIGLYHQMFPDNKIFIISKKDYDEAFDEKYRALIKKGGMIRIILDEDFLMDETDVSDFKDSLVVFDDIENLTGAMKKKVYWLKDYLALTGRSNNIYLILCNHLAMNYRETRTDLGECDAVVVFQSGNKLYIENLLKKHCGLNKSQIADVFDLLNESRWCFVKKTVPSYIVTEHKVVLL
jgi:hypothetical protein